MFHKCTVSASYLENSIKHPVFMSFYAQTQRTTGALSRWFRLIMVGLCGRPDATLTTFGEIELATTRTDTYVPLTLGGQWIYP